MNQISRCQALLGTLVEISISADCADSELLAATEMAFERVKEIHHTLSFHDPHSELNHINQNAHKQPVSLSKTALDVMQLAQHIHQCSGGLFDVTVAPLLIHDGYLPNSTLIDQEDAVKIGQHWIELTGNMIYFHQPLLIDLGGIAKGYAVDQALAAIEDHLGNTIAQASVNAGGDLKVKNWQHFEVLIPAADKSIHTRVMQNAALATSSTYYLEGKTAIYHPQQQQQIEGHQTISVFADQCAAADALTKVALSCPASDPLFTDLGAQVVLT